MWCSLFILEVEFSLKQVAMICYGENIAKCFGGLYFVLFYFLKVYFI